MPPSSSHGSAQSPNRQNLGWRYSWFARGADLHLPTRSMFRSHEKHYEHGNQIQELRQSRYVATYSVAVYALILVNVCLSRFSTSVRSAQVCEHGREMSCILLRFLSPASSISYDCKDDTRAPSYRVSSHRSHNVPHKTTLPDYVRLHVLL